MSIRHVIGFNRGRSLVGVYDGISLCSALSKDCSHVFDVGEFSVSAFGSDFAAAITISFRVGVPLRGDSTRI